MAEKKTVKSKTTKANPKTSIIRLPGAMRNWISSSLLTLAAVAVLLVVMVFSGAANFFGFGAEKETTITSDVLRNSLQDVAQLSLKEYHFSSTGKFDERWKLFDIGIPLTGKSFLATYDGVVNAGIRDFSAIAVTLDHETRSVEITAPRVEVLSTHIDPSSVKQYDQSFNPLNQVQLQDVTKFLAAEEAKAEKDALQAGLLKQAQAQAETVIKTHLLGILGAVEAPSKESLSEDAAAASAPIPYRVTFIWK